MTSLAQLSYTVKVKALLILPPLTQLNTPYPATAYLTGFLKKSGIAVAQADLGLQLVLKLLSQAGLSEALPEIQKRGGKVLSPSVLHFIKKHHQICRIIDPVIGFLQGKDPALAYRINSREYLPEGPRFSVLTQFAASEESDGFIADDGRYFLNSAFGSLGLQDQAKFLASLFIDDLADAMREGLDSRFELSRYGEKLAASQASFDDLRESLEASPPTLLDRWLDDLAVATYQHHFAQVQGPHLVGLTAPFPGNVYGAFRIARAIRQYASKSQKEVTLVLGGGYVNTELRWLKETAVFDYFDFITLDDGERPMLALLEYLAGKRDLKSLCRTFYREGSGAQSRVAWSMDSKLHDIPHKDVGTPSYEGLPLDQYLSLFEMLNPMHRLWSDGRWNKLTLAHGCYWKKCNFCDVNLDYIGRYDASASVELIVDRMREVLEHQGQKSGGFHFVDEAAPPALLKALSQRLIETGMSTTWWGNVRFEKSFTPQVAQLMAKAGCIAVSGGLEVASDRLLKLMNKGVSVEQVARVTHGLTDAGIMVHAYLMYGFPSQTIAETVDALERVRQLFETGCIQSAFWHRFSVTAHSPIGRDPQAFGVEILNDPRKGKEAATLFACNDLEFIDLNGPQSKNQEQDVVTLLGKGLKRALFNYMHGTGYEMPLRDWFVEAREAGIKIPKTTVDPNLIESALS